MLELKRFESKLFGKCFDCRQKLQTTILTESLIKIEIFASSFFYFESLLKLQLYVQYNFLFHGKELRICLTKDHYMNYIQHNFTKLAPYRNEEQYCDDG